MIDLKLIAKQIETRRESQIIEKGLKEEQLLLAEEIESNRTSNSFFHYLGLQKIIERKINAVSNFNNMMQEGCLHNISAAKETILNVIYEQPLYLGSPMSGYYETCIACGKTTILSPDRRGKDLSNYDAIDIRPFLDYGSLEIFAESLETTITKIEDIVLEASKTMDYMEIYVLKSMIENRLKEEKRTM